MSTKHTPTLPKQALPKQSTNRPHISTIDDTLGVSAWDLQTTQGTLQGIITAFDDIATVLQLIGQGKLSTNQIQALARITQNYAYEWSVTADSERQEVAQMLVG